MNSNYEKIGIYGLLFLVPLFWGGAFSAGKHIVTEVPPITTAALRFGSAGLLLFMIVSLKKKWNFKLLRERWLGIILMSLSGIFAYNCLFFWGLQLTSATNGSLIIATAPVFITIGAVLFQNEKWHKSLGIGMILSLCGVLIVITKGSLKTLSSLSFNQGDILFLGAMLSWVAYGLLGRTVMKGLPPLQTTTITTMVGSIFLFIGSIFEGGWKDIPNMTGMMWVEMLYMIIFASVIAFFLWNLGIFHVGASKASAFMNFVPIHAMWTSVVLYKAELFPAQILGVLLVIIGVSVTTLLKKNNR